MHNGLPQRVLVTGAAGFVGGRLARALRDRLPAARLILTDHGGPGVHDRMDVADADQVNRVIAREKPDALVHLAAVSSVQDSFADPQRAWRINVLGTLNIVLGLQAHAPDCHLLFVSSAEVYGRSSFSGAPVTETTLLQPANPYAVTKAAADLLVQEAAGRGLFATIVRPFNHTGPGQADNFVIPAFSSQIARIECGLQPPVIKVGELDDERDFLDVDDVVDLYAGVIERGRRMPNGLVLNAASGRGLRIGDLLNVLLSLSRTPIKVEVDPARLRASRVPRIVGDASRALDILEWRPQVEISDTLERTLEYWRSAVT